MKRDYNKYGNHSSHKGRLSTPWNCTYIGKASRPVDLYDRLVEIAEGLMRKFKDMSEDCAMEKASSMLEKKDELY